MRNFTMFFSVLLIMLIGKGCSKPNHIEFQQVVALNVIHAMLDVPSIKVDQTGGHLTYSMISEQVNYGSSRFYYYHKGKYPFLVLGSPDSLVVVNSSLTLSSRVNSMFITGEASKPDTMFYEESTFPFVLTDVFSPILDDSVLYVRFVNLSPTSPSLKVTLATSPEVNEVENLNYKTVTDFKAYSAQPSSPTRYIFQVRDASSNALLTSVTLNRSITNLFKCVALVIRGEVGRASPYNLRASIVNYF